MADKFLTITNRDIYNEIKSFKKANAIQHEEIIKHQLVTNGKVQLNKWIATTAITLVLLVGGILANHLLN